MTIKVMKLDAWMERELFDPNDSKSCEPVFNRNGQYYDTKTKKCWFEVDGDAWDITKDNIFLYELSLLNHRPLRDEERKAIKTLVMHKLAPKQLRELLETDNHIREFRVSMQRLKILKNRFIKKIKKDRK